MDDNYASQQNSASSQMRTDAPALGFDAGSPVPGEGDSFLIAPAALRAGCARPYERASGDPVFRPLRIFALDPAASRREGAVARVHVPYEPLRPGPISALFEVVSDDAQHGGVGIADLDHPHVLIRDGYEPSTSDPCFHQQMVYAVCTSTYAAFRTALGRHVGWSFGGPNDEAVRLKIRPNAVQEENAWYDPDKGELCFGWYTARRGAKGRNLPGGRVYTCLSHDIVAHEVTHALLDGLRSCFSEPTGPDVLAFHEGFADLVAIFQRFSYPDVVQAAIRRAGPDMWEADRLLKLAVQFGHTSANGELRSPVRMPKDGSPKRVYDTALECHELGSVLVSAVFEAFVNVFERKIEPYLRLVAAASREADRLPHELEQIVARKAARLASQFLALCIRAVDYCPPVDVQLGDYLRALITADADLIPHDSWGYREALIDAFRAREIFPYGVLDVSEHSLLWRPMHERVDDVQELSFAELVFDGDPGRPANARELRRQAGALGRLVCQPRLRRAFGLANPGEDRLMGDRVSLPRIESVRTSRRVGPDGQLTFDLVAEVTQRRTVAQRDGLPDFDLIGGSTIILGPRGEIRYVIKKSIGRESRLATQRAWMLEKGQAYWGDIKKPNWFKLVHAEATPPAGRT